MVSTTENSPNSSRIFHPAVQSWFDETFERETEVQTKAWQEITTGNHVLIAAPTGSGKTLAAFLSAISDLVIDSRKQSLEDGVRVLYVSPLKALSNDIDRNLQQPLAGVDERLVEAGEGPSGIRTMVRTGDTTPGEREKMRRHPPQILVTTPESLYLLLTSVSGRNMLVGVQTVIVDEIHAVAGSKRGSHLSLSLARLDALVTKPPRRIGLSATQNPIELIADFLTGGEPCTIVDTGHQRERDLQLELPRAPLTPVMANEVWEEIYDRMESLVRSHKTTLIFVNTRRLAERLARHLAERIGEDSVTAHHGSLSRDHRLQAEQALKTGKLAALVATASLELGIDIGHVDLVCQVGSPGSISAYIQRVGRAGHAVGEVPKGRLFPMTRDDLVECIALMQAVDQGLLDTVSIPDAPLDVLAQQLVAEVSAREWSLDELHKQVRQAWPYRDLERADFDSVVHMLAAGYATRRGRRSAFLHHDAVNSRVRPRANARLTALQNGGAIPDNFDYEVLMLPQSFRVGTLNEDFAFESLPGDIFQLGNTSYRILKVEQGRVLVEDAHGQPPTIPFWVGDAPGRSDELSAAVSNLRVDLQQYFKDSDHAGATQWLLSQGFAADAVEQALAYLSAAHDSMGCLPTQEQVVMERFFDDTGDMHLVIHAPFGSRIMRAWGLALRKRFCRRFNFELQAAALEDCLILSLGETHSFEMADVAAYLNSNTVREVLIQALLDAPMFEVRWRWNATIALGVQRMRNGKKLPPQWQRNQAEDLVAVVFPDQIACLENIKGEREIPDHPLVEQTIADCLSGTMDIDGLIRVLKCIEGNEVNIRCMDLNAPSPLAAEIINARPYAFLDDGDAENRRTRAISHNPDDLSNAATLSIISMDAVEQVREEAWIRPRNPDELHDGLMQMGFLTQAEFTSGCSSTGTAGEAARWTGWFKALAEEMRASCIEIPGGQRYWVATERMSEWLLIHPDCIAVPDTSALLSHMKSGIPDRDEAIPEMLRSRLSGLGPVTVDRLSEDFGLPESDIVIALRRLQGEGYVIAMQQAETTQTESLLPDVTSPDIRTETPSRWCERRLLARVHRYSRERRRRASRPVSPAAYMRFLLSWHGLDEPFTELQHALVLLEGWCAPVATWEGALLSDRCESYSPQRLDELFLGGALTWFRPAGADHNPRQLVAATPIAIVPRRNFFAWGFAWQVQSGTYVAANGSDDASNGNSDSVGEQVLNLLKQHGAMFTEDLALHAGVLPTQLEQTLGSLIAGGLITADAFSPLRWLSRPEAEKHRRQKMLKRRKMPMVVGLLGRWSTVINQSTAQSDPDKDFGGQAAMELVCHALLKRYGVVFRAVIERENLLPPWRLILRYLRRMEDRGEVNGGRFVDGFSGEQFALPEATKFLRSKEEAPESAKLTVINATDPLNLGGIITAGSKTPAKSGNRILLENGVPVARLMGDKLEMLSSRASDAIQLEAEQRLRVVRSLPGQRSGQR